jgi:hypothetical protein
MKKYCTPELEITYMNNKDTITLSVAQNAYNGFDDVENVWDWSL